MQTLIELTACDGKPLYVNRDHVVYVGIARDSYDSRDDTVIGLLYFGKRSVKGTPSEVAFKINNGMSMEVAERL